MAEKLLIIGNGMASVRLCEELAAHAPGRFKTTVVGGEPQPGYNRVLLSALLAGDIGEKDVALRSADWYRERGIRLSPASASSGWTSRGRCRPAYRRRRASASTALSWRQARPPRGCRTPGMDLPGVTTFRDLADLSGAAGGGAKHRAASR